MTASIFILALASSDRMLVALDPSILYQADTKLIMQTPAILELPPGTRLSAEGSKLQVTVKDCSWRDFQANIAWERGIPGYLESTKAEDRDFNFDLIQQITVLHQDLKIRVERVAVAKTHHSYMYIIVHKGSPPIRILECGFQPEKR